MENINKFKIMANCITCEHPLVNFTNHLLDLIEVQEIETAEEFRIMMQGVLDTGYFVHVNTKNLCCPDCPTENCGAGIYFLGTYEKFELFVEALEASNKQVNLCCTNYLMGNSNYSGAQTFYSKFGCELYSCCNDFNSSFMNEFLSQLILIAGINSLIVVNDLIESGIIEYSTINGHSSLGILLECANKLPVIFRPSFLQITRNYAIIISCDCQQDMVGVMNINRFEECYS